MNSQVTNTILPRPTPAWGHLHVQDHRLSHPRSPPPGMARLDGHIPTAWLRERAQQPQSTLSRGQQEIQREEPAGATAGTVTVWETPGELWKSFPAAAAAAGMLVSAQGHRSLLILCFPLSSSLEKHPERSQGKTRSDPSVQRNPSLSPENDSVSCITRTKLRTGLSRAVPARNGSVCPRSQEGTSFLSR